MTVPHALVGAFGALAVLASAPAPAQEAASPFYIGATFGASHWRPGCPNSALCDDTDRALRVLAGYRINRFLAAEVGFHNLGNISGGGARIKANAWEAVLVASWPLANAFSVYGKLGAYRGNAKGSWNEHWICRVRHGGRQYGIPAATQRSQRAFIAGASGT